MSVEVIQSIRRPGREDAATDFPIIAFRSVVHEPVVVYTDVTAHQVDERERRET